MSEAAYNQPPSSGQLFLPLLEELNATGATRPVNIYDRLATRLSLSEESRSATIQSAGQNFNIFERNVRWARQVAVARGLIDAARRGIWDLTEAGKANLRNIVRGVMLTVYETDSGFILWADATDALSIIEKNLVQLIFTSPPYPLLREKTYGNMDERRWLDWMLRLCEGWRELLTPSGSMMINLGPTWTAGKPTQSLYVERLLIALEEQLGIHLLQRLDWWNPGKLPCPAEYVTVKRIRVTPAVEPVLWLSPNPDANASNRNVLREYSDSMKRAMAQGSQGTMVRPSGHTVAPTMLTDNGGSIAHSLLQIANTDSNSAFLRTLRETGRTPHPARFPEALAEFGIKLASEEGDVVYDPMSGSGTTFVVAHRLNRRGIASEKSLEYIEQSRIRCELEGIQTRTVCQFS